MRETFSDPGAAVALSGLAFVTVTTLLGAGFSLLALPFAVWAAVPYAVLWVVARRVRRPWVVAGAGAAGFAVDAGIRAAVFVWPRGSTAALALIFSPALVGLVAMPFGAAAGWLAGGMWRRHLAGRVVVLTLAPIVLGLTILGFARPELFPLAVLRRHAVLERVGPPRVVAGENLFESRTISHRPASYVVGELDDHPGVDVAFVDHAGADVHDTTTLAKTARVEFGGGQVWGSFSTLARLPDGRLAVVDTGGGFSRTLVKDLNGVVLWEYRPDPALAPDALRPADLDADGVVEFYGVSTESIARLGADGRELWRQPSRMASLIALLPQEGERPAWIVGLEYGRKWTVWGTDGRVLAERPVAERDSPVTAIDSFAGRLLIHGGRTVRGYDLAGTPRLELPFGEFTLSEAHGVRLSVARPPYAALVGATDRFTQRYRVLIVGAEGVVYDEITDQYPRLIAARRADGSDALFVRSGTTLRLMRMR